MTATQQEAGVGPGTALPWTIYADDNAPHRYPGIEGSNETVVVFGDEGEFEGVRGPTPQISAANAAYIVLACNSFPKLVEALEAMVAARKEPATIKGIHGDADVGPRWDITALNRALPAARAILSSTKGDI